MDSCEKWNFTDFGTKIAVVTVKLKKLLEIKRDSNPII